MSQDDVYEGARSSLLQKIESLQTKVNSITIKTTFKQTTSNDLIMIYYFFESLHNSNLKNTIESVRRFIVLNRSLYVDTMSAFEYETRKFILIDQDSQLDPIKQILHNHPRKGITPLITKLKQIGYLDDDNCKKLIGLFAIRNMIVHNNTIVNDQKDEVPPEIQEIFADFTIDNVMNGKPEMFLNLFEILIDIYLVWYNGKSTLEDIFNRINRQVIN